MKKIIDSAGAISRWLKKYNPQSEQEKIMLLNAINLIECIENSTAPDFFEERTIHAEIVRSLNQLVLMERDDLLNFCRTSGSVEQLKSIRNIGIVVSHMAHSFARVDDLQMVAVLLRSLALINGDINLSGDVWNYLFNQQQADGSFGLFSAERMLLKYNDKASMSNLIITVEVLITFAVVKSMISVNGNLDLQQK